MMMMVTVVQRASGLPPIFTLDLIRTKAETKKAGPNTADPKQHRTPPEHHTPPRVLLKTPLSVCLSVRLNRKCFRVLNLRQVSDQ